MSTEEILARLSITDHYYCDTGPNQLMEHVSLSGYLTQEQYAELVRVVNTWWKQTS